MTLRITRVMAPRILRAQDMDGWAMAALEQIRRTDDGTEDMRREPRFGLEAVQLC
jgi:hypothetical protein